MGDDDLLVERLLRVIDEGRRTATYKLALIMALIDAVALKPGESELPTRLIAEQVVSLYYPQSRMFVASDGIEHELRQITMKGSSVLRRVLRLRLLGDASGCRLADDVRDRHPREYEAALAAVEDTFVRYPIPLMQVVGTVAVPFLYWVDWPEGTSVNALRSQRRDRLRLLTGVSDRLAVLGPMLRPLIELHWTRDVARWSRIGIDDEALRAHLFGSDRIGFTPVLVRGLRDLQDGQCFYCGEPLGTKVEVDHFIAWSRWPNNAIENLVLADRCNSAKSDHLAAAEHLHHWQSWLDNYRIDLAELAETSRVRSDRQRTLALARTTYSHVPAGMPLWRQGRDFDTAVGPLMV